MLTQYTVQRSEGPLTTTNTLRYPSTLDTPEGYVSFDYMLSSEMRYDELTFSIDGMEYMAASGQDYHWEFLCDTAGSYSGTSWEESSLNDGSIPGEWVNDGYADCGDTDGDGTSDDEGVSDGSQP